MTYLYLIATFFMAQNIFAHEVPIRIGENKYTLEIDCAQRSLYLEDKIDRKTDLYIMNKNGSFSTGEIHFVREIGKKRQLALNFSAGTEKRHSMSLLCQRQNGQDLPANIDISFEELNQVGAKQLAELQQNWSKGITNRLESQVVEGSVSSGLKPSFTKSAS